jgi:F0F1-type ATP synthase assembly protein I
MNSKVPQPEPPEEPQPGDSVREVQIPGLPTFREPPPMPDFPSTAPLRTGAKHADFKRDEKPTPMRGMSRAYALAIEFIVYVGVCGGLGYLVDTYAVGKGQTWTVVGMAFGLLGAMIRLVRASKSLMN